jgi:hypothetical protein
VVFGVEDGADHLINGAFVSEERSLTRGLARRQRDPDSSCLKIQQCQPVTALTLTLRRQFHGLELAYSVGMIAA